MGTPPALQFRRARVATGLLFVTNGALLANLIPRYPEIKAALGMTDSLFGLSVAAFPLGAMIFGVFAAGLIRRFGSGMIATLTTIMLAGCLAATVFMPEVALFALALLLAGGADAIADVSQNAHGLRVQDAYGRSILNSFHALWSFGAVLGGLMAAGVLYIELDLHVHLVASAICFSLVALIAWKMALPRKVVEQPPEASAGTHVQRRDLKRMQWLTLRNPSTLLVIAALVLLAMAEAVVEDSGNSWSALYLSVSLDAPSALAALGFTALVAGQLVGRATADRFVDRFGQRLVIRTGGFIIAIGMGVALVWPTIPLTIAGFGAAGFGSSAIIPAAYNAADNIPGLRPGVGLTVVSWFMRLGFLLAPPIVGALSDLFSLRWALFVVPLAGVLTMLLARVLPEREAQTQQRL